MDIFTAALLVGLVLGFALFFILYLRFRNKKPSRAGSYTFFAGLVMICLSIFAIGGFEGMPYGMVGLGFLIAGVAGWIIAAVLNRKR